MAEQAEKDLEALAEAERIRRDKKRLAAAKAERDRIRERVRAEERRTGARLLDTGAPKKIKRGKFKEPAKTSKQVIQKKPSTVINVITGRETRLKVERAVQ